MKRNPLYLNSYGNWKVTTEGDCEGRTIRDLGTHLGHVDEIAFRLAGSMQGGYSLQFQPALSLPDPTPVSEVSVSLGVDSDTWDMKAEDRAEFVGLHMFRDRPVRVGPSNFHAVFILTRGKNDTEMKTEMKDLRRRIALSKLDPGDREVLGLKDE